jgi:pantothenate kinase-related protein Tda10
MKPSELDNAQLGADTLNAFFEQFGTMDEQSKIVLEYVLELICKAAAAESKRVQL